MNDAFAVVVATHNSTAQLEGLVTSVLGQLDNHDELVIVDNASTDGTAARARTLDRRLRVIEMATNAGFPSACRVGVDATTAPVVFLLNPDTVLMPGALSQLRSVASEHPEWAAWQPVVLIPDGHINTAGGVVHFLGLGWAGQCGRDATELAEGPYEAAFASDAALVVRRDIWQELDGLRDDYFRYGEDLDLGLRLWLSGHRVGVEPRARAIHTWDYDKSVRKSYLLERNRWRTVLSTYPLALLVAVAPMLLAAELGILVVAARHGWLLAKLRAQLAAAVGLPRTLARRRVVQRTRRVGAAAFATHLTADFDSQFLRVPRAVQTVSRVYWRLALALLR